MADEQSKPYTQDEEPGGINPSLPPNQFLGQVLHKITGLGVDKSEETADSVAPMEGLAEPVGLVAAPLAGALGNAMARDAGAVVGNEIGTVGSNVKQGVGLGELSSPGVRLRVERALGIPKDMAPQEKIEILHKAMTEGKIPHEDFSRVYAAYSKSFAEGGQVEAPAAAPAAPAAPEVHNLLTPEGDLVGVASHQLQAALEQGFTPAPQERVDTYAREQKYGSFGQQAVTLAEGAASAATFGLSTGLERAMGVPAEDIQAREETNPVAHGVGTLASLLVPGAPEAMALAKTGSMVAKGAEAVMGTSALAKIGSKAAAVAAENALFQTGDEAHKMFAGSYANPTEAVEMAIPNIGLAAVIGGSLGGALGAVSPLWAATGGKQLGGLLGAVQRRLGGVEGIVEEPLDQALSKLGIEATPEIRSALSSDPHVREMASALSQSDTTGAGKAFQQTQKDFRKSISDSVSKGLGREPEAIVTDFSEAAAGDRVGTALAKEYKAKIDPIAELYDGNRAKYSKSPLSLSVADKAVDLGATQSKLSAEISKTNKMLEKAMKNGDVEGAVGLSTKLEDLGAKSKQLESMANHPGAVDSIADTIAKRVQEEGWHGTDDIMKEINRIGKRLPSIKTIGELQKEMQIIGNNTASTLPFGQQTPLSRAGGILKSILRDAEAESMAATIGAEEGAEALGLFNEARRRFAAQAELKDALNDRLKVGGSTSGYHKGIAEMARTDGESLLRRLSGHKDADILRVLEANFPETAQALRETHMDRLLSQAAKGAKDGESISLTSLMKAVDKMSPEMRSFVLSAEQEAKIKAAKSITEQLADKTHNYSNTARTVLKLTKDMLASTVGLAGALAGHNPIASVLVGGLVHALGKDLPDAARLGMLKFLGSGKTLSPEKFAAAVHFIDAAVKGEKMANRAVKNIFKPSMEVLGSHFMPSAAEKAKLDKYLVAHRDDPNLTMKAADNVSHYMPEQGMGVAQIAAGTVQYLNQLRPESKAQSPLDTRVPASNMQKMAYDRALTIASQPLAVLNGIQSGAITQQDVKHLRIMYPQLYQKLQGKIMDQVADIMSKEGSIPYRTRMGLSVFMGQPMDSTMSSASILAAQPQPKQSQQPTQQAPKRNNPDKLNKLPKSYMTPGQASEQDQAKR